MTLETPLWSDAGLGGGISLGPTAAQEDLRTRMAAFVADALRPRERELLLGHGDIPWQVVQELRARAREHGVYAPHVPAEYGGLGLDWRSVGIAFEEAGTSLLGPLAINAAAPDEGNMHLLEVTGRPDQKQRYLRPLADGRTRSCFAMTEPPPGAGADPNLLRTRATRLPEGGWSISGQKWFITGARGAAFAIVMARTSDDPDPRRGATMFLVDAGTRGFEVVRDMPTLDHATFYGGHAEVRFADCRVPEDAILGEADRGFEYAQVRLVPARLTHCMRWLGVARRAHEIAAQYATERTSFGQALGEHQMVQAMLADSAIDLHAARLLVWHAAWKLDLGQPAREESGMAKVFVAEAVNRVVDRSVQVCGGMGTTDDLLLGLFYREVRSFRIYDGPSEVHRAAIARRVLRRARSQAARASARP